MIQRALISKKQVLHFSNPCWRAVLLLDLDFEWSSVVLTVFLSHSGLLCWFLFGRTVTIFTVYVASLQDKLLHFYLVLGCNKKGGKNRSHICQCKISLCFMCVSVVLCHWTIPILWFYCFYNKLLKIRKSWPALLTQLLSRFLVVTTPCASNEFLFIS